MISDFAIVNNLTSITLGLTLYKNDRIINFEIKTFCRYQNGCDLKIEISLMREENIVKKGEKGWLPAFSLTFAHRVQKVLIYWNITLWDISFGYKPSGYQILKNC